jgi:hypothetical protein
LPTIQRKMKTPLKIDQQKAIESLLSEMYLAEFEITDGYDSHPRGWSFYRWLYEKRLINIENLNEIESEIKEESKLDYLDEYPD